MKNNILLLILTSVIYVLTIQHTYSQPTVEKVRQISDSLNKPSFRLDENSLFVYQPPTSSDKSGLFTIESPIYKKYVDTKFTYLTYQRGTFPNGNSASIELENNETKLNASIAKKVYFGKKKTIEDQNLLLATIGTKASLSNGVVNLFSGNIPAVGNTLFANFSFLPKKANYDCKIVISEFLNGRKIKTAYDSLQDNIINFKNRFSQTYGDQYVAKYTNLICRWNEIRIILCDTSKACCQNQTNLILEKAAIEQQLNEAGLIDKDAGTIINDITSKFEDDYYKLITDKPIWERFTLRWFNLGISYTRQLYNTYDSTLSIRDRFDIKHYNDYSIKLTHNWFVDKFREESVIRSFYANLSYELRSLNSFSALTNQDLIKTINATVSGDTSIVYQSNNKALDITGLPYQSAAQHNFSGAFTGFFGKEKNIGLNILAETKLSTLSHPIYNLRLGLIGRFINNQYNPDNEDSKSKVNIEIFLQITDLNNAIRVNKTPWQDRLIGLNTSIPFSKIFFN